MLHMRLLTGCLNRKDRYVCRTKRMCIFGGMYLRLLLSIVLVCWGLLASMWGCWLRLEGLMLLLGSQLLYLISCISAKQTINQASKYKNKPNNNYTIYPNTSYPVFPSYSHHQPTQPKPNSTFTQTSSTCTPNSPPN